MHLRQILSPVTFLVTMAILAAKYQKSGKIVFGDAINLRVKLWVVCILFFYLKDGRISPRKGYLCWGCDTCDGKNHISQECPGDAPYCGVKIQINGEVVDVSRGCVENSPCRFNAESAICGCQGQYCNKGALLGANARRGQNITAYRL